MFTGLVEAIGVVERARRDEKGLNLVIRSPFTDLSVGESVAVDGACLTVTELKEGTFRVHVVRSSQDRTCFEDYYAGRRVNLERALRVGDRLGGHIVQGHVDGVGTIDRITDREDARLLDIRVPSSVFVVSVPLGSITVDGVSLTVNALPAKDTVQVSLIPHTREQTTLGDRKAGDRVHLEGDTLGKYVRQMVVKGDESTGDT
jgi:riboflavin synthase